MSECIEHPENAPEYEGLKVNKGIEQPDPMNPNIAACRILIGVGAAWCKSI